jgi:DNA polymerase III epsilon subunit-like protein
MKHPIMFVDVETGGLDPHKHSLLIVAWSVIDTSDKIVDNGTASVLLPEYSVTPFALQVNGLNVIDVAREGEKPDWISSLLCAILHKHSTEDGRGRIIYPRLGGHNTAFDAGFLDAQLPGFKGYHHHELVDTKGIASFLRDAGLIDPPSLSLGDLYQHILGRPLLGAHSAVNDVTATMDVYFELMKLVKKAL